MDDVLFKQTAIFMPVLITLLLGLIIWLLMFAVRFKAIAAANIQPDQLATPDMVRQALPLFAQHSANNFKNFFEVPMMFFVLCFYLHATGNVDSLYVNLAWVFVAFRYVHSAIHCSYNNVNHRFGAYAISCLALWTMLIRALLAAF
jgi:hypothetical protein